MPKARRLVSKSEVLNEFLDRLSIEKPTLYYSLPSGVSTIELIRTIAKTIGYKREIKEEDKIVDTLNAIWPFVVEYKE